MEVINSIEDLRAHRKTIARAKKLNKIYNRAIEALEQEKEFKAREKKLSDGVSSSWHVLPYIIPTNNNKKYGAKCFIPSESPLITARRIGEKCSTDYLYNELTNY